MIGDMARPEHVLLTAAERDALVAAAREIAQLRADLLVAKARIAGANLIEARLAECEKELEEAKRGPEMPADVAAMVAKLKDADEYFEHNGGKVDLDEVRRKCKKAAALIESLERQRRETQVLYESAVLNRNYYADERKKAEARAEQAEKELAEARQNLDAGREWMRAAWHEFNAIRARDGAPEGVGQEWWSEITDGLGSLIGDDTVPWMTDAAKTLVAPYEKKIIATESCLAKLEAVVAAALHGGAGTKEYDDLVALAALDRKEP